MASSSEQILIIDDDKGIKSLVQNFLRNRNPEIYQTEDGENGFPLAQGINPMFVILSADIKNGFLICRKFKKDKFLRKVPLILVSNKGASKVFREHRKLPTRADGYLIKPFSEDEFLALLGEVAPEKFSDISSETSFVEGGDRTIVST
ncbi:MAG: response regulator, partial [Deltaproteobacteria bacterium]|nr:response regulator [Deltaproteobacteria bacterium]